MSIDTERFRTELLEERAACRGGDRAVSATSHPGSLDDEVEEIAAGERQPPRRHGDRDARPRDRLHARRELRAGARRRSTPRSSASRTARTAPARAAARRSRRSGSRRIPGRRSASTTRARRSAVERAGPPPRRPRRLVDERAGAGLVRGALACGRADAVARARGDRARGGRGRPADEAHRHEPARARRRRARGRAVLDPPRPELGHRVRALLAARRRS